MRTSLLALACLAVTLTGCGLVDTPRVAGPEPSATPSVAPSATVSPSAAASPGGSASPSPSADSGPVLASVLNTDTPTLKVDLVGLNRVEGKHLLVRLRLTNLGQEKTPWSASLQDEYGKDGSFRWTSGIGVLDTAARRWLMPYKTADGECVCTDQEGDGLRYFIDPGQSIEVHAVVPAPSGDPDVTTVVTPATPPMVNVPISDEPPPTPMPDLSGVSTVAHVVSTPSESLDKSEETTDDGRNLEVNLSSDVLFALNEAKLTAKAETILARAATLINSSTGPTVAIAGHADSSGTDAINDPLSRRRAEAVRRALAPLVTRSGVRFTAQGYGSRRPLYGNDDEEGRRRNRRVTVTFAKPQQGAGRPTANTDVLASPATPAPAATTATAEVAGQPFSLEVTGLRRLPDGLGVLTYRITNKGGKETWHHRLSNSTEWMSYKYIAASNVRLTDPVARRQYLPGRVQVATGDGTDAYCACTGVAGVRLGTEKFAPGQSREFYTLFELPSAPTALTVKISDFPQLQAPIT
ncbi:OmpA family protein [Nonomuraea sp. NPDC005983]|uniref:OmpA family protein n=1 Tax=Nonomuraea sp. NPDC005983 TaxID=3155595 RepID=UPI00339F9A1D